MIYNLEKIKYKIKILNKNPIDNYYELLNIFKELIIKYYSLKYNNK
jgi:hypothetical protein